MMRYLLFSLVFLAAPAHGQEVTGAAPVIARSVEQVIKPAYEAFAAAARREDEAVSAYCAGEGEFAAAQQGFETLVTAFAAIEPYRFGPARQDNTYEKLFFWPDRRGITGRQVRALLADEALATLPADELREKSVAVQGLNALELALEEAPGPGTPACHYAALLSELIAERADVLAASWQTEAEYPQAMLTASTPYQNETEVVGALVKALTEQIEITADIKIGRAMGETPAAARPQLLPFYKSANHVKALQAGVLGLRRAFDEGGFALLLEPESLWIAEQVVSELERAANLLEESAAMQDPFASEEGRSLMTNAIFALKGARTTIEQQYAPAIGLTLGFNSTDGD